MGKTRLVDIAKEAGVSVATVSYVLNNQPNQKISEDMRLKIKQIASLLNYQKNSAASALAKGQTNVIGLCLNNNYSELANSEYLTFILRLSQHLTLNGYMTTLISGGQSLVKNNVDSILVIGSSDQEFINISQKNNIPTLAIETIKHIPWTFSFYHVFKDAGQRYALDDYTLLTFEPKSAQLKEMIIKNNPKTIFVNTYDQIPNLIPRLKDENVIVAGETLFSILHPYGLKLYSYPLFTENMINDIVYATELAIKHQETDTHDYEY